VRTFIRWLIIPQQKRHINNFLPQTWEGCGRIFWQAILAFEEIGPFDPFDYAQGRLSSGQALIGFELALFGFVFLGRKAVSFS